MSLLSGGALPSRMRSYCAFQNVQPMEFINRTSYKSPCSEDASQDDGTYICQYHLSRYFKIEKTSLMIPDGIGTPYYRLIGKSLINQSSRDRILIPTADNYQTVLNLPMMSPSERLIMHMIYRNKALADELCVQFRQQESFSSVKVELITGPAARLIYMTDPDSYCSSVNNPNEVRLFVKDPELRVYTAFPPYIKNLINKLVAPEVLTIGATQMMLKNSATVAINNTGLVAIKLYNEVIPKYVYTRNDNVLEIKNVLQFVGNDNALNKKLARYECHPIIVQLFLGSHTIGSISSETNTTPEA
ncbi:vp39 [Leucania separata nucleopolyhedrovirus]|uniref:Vp39 n=1 Tax=Leucania separata nucleopolyhedrovirus TaxID=1307956 RepID=Q0IL23_NPVLS|nr:vp39 [Leucania separata nucleopolyhedrovirus]AAR28860.1 vp39 [Leucania separata nucleopolyhedrovirus]